MLLDPYNQCWSSAVEQEEAQGGKDVKEQADAQSPEDLDVEWIIGLDQNRPGHGEEEKIEGGAIAGECRYDKEREGGD